LNIFLSEDVDIGPLDPQRRFNGRRHDHELRTLLDGGGKEYGRNQREISDEQKHVRAQQRVRSGHIRKRARRLGADVKQLFVFGTDNRVFVLGKISTLVQYF
jgi:hypothetical protein